MSNKTWRWIKCGESEAIVEGDTVALILEQRESSGLSHTEQDVHAACEKGGQRADFGLPLSGLAPTSYKSANQALQGTYVARIGADLGRVRG